MADVDLSAWRHRLVCRIDNTRGPRALSDYSVKVELAASNFDFAKAQPAGRDLRFSDPQTGRLLPYWVDSYEPRLRRAVVWVRLPAIPGQGAKVIHLHFGNPAAPPGSDGPATFDFFDDCERGDAGEKWELAFGAAEFSYARYADAFLRPGGVWHASGAKDRVSPRARTVYGGAHATYCAWTRPMAVYAAPVNKTFFAFGNVENAPTVACYDHKTKQFSHAVAVGANPDMDAHKNPHLLIDDDGYLYVFHRSHCSPTHLVKSTRPYDIGEWQAMGPVVARSSYPQPWQLRPGEITVLYRGGGTHDATESMVQSIDGGKTWSEPRHIVATPPANGCYAVSVAETGAYPRRVHLAWSVTRGKWWERYHVYYAYSDDGGDTWKRSDGKPYDLPVTEEASDMIFESDVPDRGVWLKDIQLDSKGNPYILFIDANTLTYECVWRVARLAAGKWTFHEVATSDHMYDAGALVFLADDVRIYAPTTPSQPYQDGGEIDEWQSTDGGATWAKTKQLTAGSKYSHNHVKAVYNGSQPDFRVFWCYGDANNPPETRDVHLYWYGEAMPSPRRMDLTYDPHRQGRLLCVSQPEKVEGVVAAKGVRLADCALDARVKLGLPQQRHSMFCLRVSDDAQLCGAALPYSRGKIYTKDPKRWHPLARGAARLHTPTSWHDWSFRACGESVALFVDDEPFVEATDPRAAAGAAGVRVRYSSMYLDDVRVRKFASPEPVAIVTP